MNSRPGTGFRGVDTIVRRIETDVSIVSNNTLAGVPGLSFSINPFEEWIASFILDVGAALATTGLRVGVNTPAGATLNLTGALEPDVLAALNLSAKRTTAIATGMDWVIATQAGVGNAVVVGSLWVRNGAIPGLVQLQAAQSTSSVTALLVRAGSILTAQRFV